MTLKNDWRSAFPHFVSSDDRVLVVVQCSSAWFHPEIVADTFQLELEMARLCVLPPRPLKLFRVISHGLAFRDIDSNASASIDSYNDWLQTIATWSRFAHPSVDVVVRRSLTSLAWPDGLYARSLGSSDEILKPLIEESIRQRGMTSLKIEDYGIANDELDLDPSLGVR